MKRIQSLALAAIVLFAILACNKHEEEIFSEKDFTVTKNVILDSDIGNSLDDLMALDILYHEQKSEHVKLLAVMINHDMDLAPEVVDIMNTWYGFPNIPIGMVRNGVSNSQIWEDYAPALCARDDFGRSVSNYADLPDPVSLYREILSQSEDSSITILSTGFFTNIARLLESGPDECSALTGKELVRRKVKTIVAMCGSSFEPEYNIANDIESARIVFSQIPVTMSIVPGEVHLDVTTDEVNQATSWACPHPIQIGFTTHLPEDENWLWDACAAVCLMKGFANTNVSQQYDATLKENGIMELKSTPGGRFRTISLTESQKKSFETFVLHCLGTEI